MDLVCRGDDADNRGAEIINRGRYATLTKERRRWLKSRQAIESIILRTKSDNRIDRCSLHGALGDALHALNCASDYNIRWPMRAVLSLAAKRHFLDLFEPALYKRISVTNARSCVLVALIALRQTII